MKTSTKILYGIGFALLAFMLIWQITHRGASRTPTSSPTTFAPSVTPSKPSTTSSTSSSPSVTGDDTGDWPIRDRKAAMSVAGGFAREYADTKTKDWPGRVGKFTVPALAKRLTTVDVKNVSVGAAKTVTLTDPSEPVAQVRAEFANGALTLWMIVDDEGVWRVMTYEKVS